ncbi:MAG: RHS repeat-associated core domain-containing protein [Chloroflexi bacterium]|nr:RHS repeat-associated core domain-containing protein [Chloroflexota bacterium]
MPSPLGAEASFLYDGDGRRVAQTLNGVTTYFVGNYYEVTGGVVTKYYYAGAQRIAMRRDGTLYYLLSDHLGSTSLTTDAGGNIISELRYTAWGEVRYNSGVTPTEYTFTGQRSYTESFGLMYYGARWYDPYITQFSQPDSIIPDLYNPQAWDRYAYTLNNPVRYTDPSGHMAWEGNGGDDTKEEVEYYRQRNDALKCQAGNDTYCSYGEKHPIEVATFTASALMGGAATETVILGGGAAAVADTAIYRAGLSCIRSTACRWLTGMAGGAGTGRVVLSGHGGYSSTNGTTTVPNGTTLHTYAPLGKPITDKLGNAIETGVVNSGEYIFGPSKQVPNLTLYPPTGLKIMGDPTTVNSPTLLSDLLVPDMGDVHWAACLVLTDC